MDQHISKRNGDIFKSFIAFAKDIKISHSIFALPFATSALFLISYENLTWNKAGLLFICMVSARSFAMGANRYLDRKIDLKNPRTSGRMIPKGELSPSQGLFWTLLWALIFSFCAFQLNTLTGLCSIPLLVFLGGYSLMKRVSALTHLYLGICLGLSPLAVSISLNGNAPASIYFLTAAIAFWTAGFDILYALQDRDFDIDNRLHSIPSKYSPRTSIYISRIFFGIMAICLFFVGFLSQLGLIYFLGMIFVYGMLFYQHWLVRDALVSGTSKNINAAFFNTNAYISILYLTVLTIDWLV